MGRFYGWSLTASRLEPFRRGSQIYFNLLNLLFSRDLPIFGKELITYHELTKAIKPLKK